MLPEPRPPRSEYVAVCCRVLLCVAVCGSQRSCTLLPRPFSRNLSVLQCVLVRCVAVCCIVLQCAAAICRVLQSVAVRRSVLQSVQTLNVTKGASPSHS